MSKDAPKRESAPKEGDKGLLLKDQLNSPPQDADMIGSSVLFLCAEPGVGKSYLASKLLVSAREEGRPTYTYTLDTLTPEAACMRMVRHSREISQKANGLLRPLVVFDGLPAGDEAQTHREARAIRRLSGQGAQVVVCLRPEGEQLIELMEDAACMRGGDFLFRGDDGGEAMELTAGIPALVVALRADRSMGDDHGYGASHYDAAMADLLVKTLRPGLTDEELRIRLAMILLGRGTMEEVALVAGRCDAEQFQWLARDVPLFGIDLSENTFFCHGLCHDKVLEHCMAALSERVAEEPQLLVRACGALAAREDIRRSAMVSRLCASESDHISICAAWGVAYVGAGEAQIVADALKHYHVSGIHCGTRERLSEVAATIVMGTARQVDAAWEDLKNLRLSDTIEERLYRRVQLLGLCRDTLRSPRQAPQYMTSEPNDVTGLACLDHQKVMRAISSGRFEEAYATLANEMMVREPRSIPEAFLCDDLLLALSLSGGIPDARERGLFAQAEAFFVHPGSRRLQAYHAAVASMPAILMSSEHNTKLLEEAAAKAERAGDVFIQALCLAVSAVADVRAHAFSRAHVRAERAVELFRVMGEEYLASSAELVDAIAREMLGDGGRFTYYCESAMRPEGLALVGRIVARATGELSGAEAGFVIPSTTPCPRNILWLINLLVSDCADVWGGLREVIPLPWIELLQSIKYRQASEAPYEVLSTAPAGKPNLLKGGSKRLGRGSQTELTLVEQPRGRVYVSIFGGFNVKVDGTAQPTSLFERRRARDFITLLSLVPGHKMRRYQAVEVLWPGEDCLRGPRKLYETTGEARKRMGGLELGTNAIVSDRLQGTVGFDAALVGCDVDDFEREARYVLTEEDDDFSILEHARRMERIYATGPDDSVAVLGELVTDRLAELRMMFVDAAVAAGEAALRLGRSRLAVRYASDALRLSDLREDAMILQVRALKAAGRGCEIPDLYKRYTRRLVETQGMPPSVTLRLVVERALEMGAGSDLDAGFGSLA